MKSRKTKALSNLTPISPPPTVEVSTGASIVISTASKKTIAKTAEDLMMSNLDHWGGDNEKADQLLSLKYVGTSENIISKSRKDIFMEVLGLLNNYDFYGVLKFLSNATSPDYILWEQPAMEKCKEKFDREISIQLAEEVGVKGIGKCKFCPSTELSYSTLQMRAGDEGATIFVRCIMCRKEWRE